MVSIITINYNLSSETIPCVESLLASEYQDFKIYLIDNGSGQEDFQKLFGIYSQHPKVKLLRIEKNCGYVGGVNYGLRNALKTNSEYFMVMNNDTVIDKAAIGYLVEAAKRYNNKAIVSGKVYYYENPEILQHTGVVFKDYRYLTTIYPGRNEKDIGQYDIEKERDSLDDVFWLLPAKVIKDVGYYCDYFFLYAEQGDYAQRARRLGYKLIYTPKAKIWHKESMTAGGGDNKALQISYWRGQGMYIFQYRNLKRKYFVRFMIKNFMKLTIKTISYKGDKRRRSYATLRGYYYGFKWMFNRRSNNGKNPYLN